MRNLPNGAGVNSGMYLKITKKIVPPITKTDSSDCSDISTKQILKKLVNYTYKQLVDV